MAKEELGEQMRLPHAIAYFSSQARTIYSGLRLTQTSHKLFTMRRLIVGLGRAPGHTTQTSIGARMWRNNTLHAYYSM